MRRKGSESGRESERKREVGMERDGEGVRERGGEREI